MIKERLGRITFLFFYPMNIGSCDDSTLDKKIQCFKDIILPVLGNICYDKSIDFQTITTLFSLVSDKFHPRLIILKRKKIMVEYLPCSIRGQLLHLDGSSCQRKTLVPILQFQFHLLEPYTWSRTFGPS